MLLTTKFTKEKHEVHEAVFYKYSSPAGTPWMVLLVVILLSISYTLEYICGTSKSVGVIF